ncbi:MAG TPA: hypothetical protein VK790_01835 [Solirubrobacteraceae bacterium]|jgi:hypothetical protein|nr:hypothetical protein [Solirubrobacteraceae bacterium]
MTVVFIDTSVLCNFLGIPGKAQQKQAVHADYERRCNAKDMFVLPMAAVIETGNHIEQLPESLGDERRRCAESLTEILRLVAEGTSPWVLVETEWNSELLEQFCVGGEGGSTPAFLDVATQGALGGGDLTILIERDRYTKRVMTHKVELWTYDQQLKAWA